jgi:hypothetical protein
MRPHVESNIVSLQIQLLAMTASEEIPSRLPAQAVVMSLIAFASVTYPAACRLRVDTAVSQTTQVPVGQCLQVDRPQRVFFRTPTSVSVTERGSYALFQPATFAAKPTVGQATPIDNAKRVQVGEFKPTTAQCHPPGTGDSVSKSYWGKLSDLTENKNYRVCFDDGYSNQGDALEYPGSLLRVLLDRTLMAKPPLGGQLDPYLYMSIEPGGCRDMFGVSDAYMLVVNNSWNDQSVSAISYRFAQIPSPK